MGTRWGAMWTKDGINARAVTTTAGRVVDWTAAVDGPACDAKVDGQIVIKVPGTYLAFANLSFIGTTGDTYTFGMYVNELTGNADIVSSVDGLTGGVVQVSLMAGAPLKEGDVVAIFVKTDNAAGSTFTLINGQFGLFSV